jgi:hypothetical protein
MLKQPFFDLLKLVCDKTGYKCNGGVQIEMVATDSRLG